MGTGRLVRELHRGRLDSGEHVLVWDGRDARGRRLPRGIYFAKLSSPTGAATARITLLPR